MIAPEVDEDDMPRLDPTALAALQEFYTERDAHQKKFEDLKSTAERGFDAQAPISMDLFSEDWNASQFWYTDATAATLARALLASSPSHIAIVSAPSVYVKLRQLLADVPDRPRITLFEFDERFAVFGDEFVRYDFKEPLKLDPALKGSFDAIICDPPFLSEDCQAKTALTARWLVRDWTAARVVVCTGERMEGLVRQLYAKCAVRTTDFAPVHAKGLSNEFKCYANFEWEEWKLG